jgi:phage antirepressor YoqD-like protein
MELQVFKFEAISFMINDRTCWATQKQIAELFNVARENITMHIKNIFDDGELDENSTCKNFLLVQNEGNRQVERNITHYNLDMIIAVGYRVNSKKATQFRIRATEVLSSYMRGELQYAMPRTFGEALQLASEKQLEVERLEIENKQQAKEIEAAKPALDFVDQVHDSKDCITVSEFAKMIGTGRNRLFKRLKELGYLMYDNKPYQKYISNGLFRVVEKVVDTPTFEHLYTQTLITPHGQTYLHHKLKTAKELQLW